MISVLAFIFGISFGSFVGLLCERIPNNISIIKPSSRCDSCGVNIKFYQNIPLISYIFLRGKCSSCNAKIKPYLFLIELFCGLVFLFLYNKFGFGILSICFALSLCLLLALSIIDFKTMQAPDSINFLALLFATLAFADDISALINHIEAALILAGCFALLRLFVGFIKNTEAMGEADIIVAATIGALLGVYGACEAIFIGCLSALPVAIYLKTKQIDRVAFIPFLSFGAFVKVAIL